MKLFNPMHIYSKLQDMIDNDKLSEDDLNFTIKNNLLERVLISKENFKIKEIDFLENL